MRPHQLELDFETDPALALRQFHEQIGRDNVGPDPRHGLEFWQPLVTVPKVDARRWGGPDR